MLSDEQAGEIRKQILKQIESWPEEQRESAKMKIEAMNNEDFEAFLIKNKLIKGDDSEGEVGGVEDSGGGGECVFCSLADKKIPSAVVSENSAGIAILEINPVSKGHLIVIPKKHLLTLEEAGKEFTDFSDYIAGIVRDGMKVKVIDRWVHSPMGHVIVNLIPIHEDTKLDFSRKKSNPEELKGLLPGYLEAVKKKEEEKREKERSESIAASKAVETVQAPIRVP